MKPGRAVGLKKSTLPLVVVFYASEGAALAPETRAAFTSALEPQQALAHPELACAACALLSCAVTSHASLADALLFPCNLERTEKVALVRASHSDVLLLLIDLGTGYISVCLVLFINAW